MRGSLPGLGRDGPAAPDTHPGRPDDEARALAAARRRQRQVVFCEPCFNISDSAPVRDLPRPAAGNDNPICVVEEPLDVLAIERTGEFRGRYHVLHGAISPIDRIGPEQMRVRELIERVGGAEAAASGSKR